MNRSPIACKKSMTNTLANSPSSFMWTKIPQKMFKRTATHDEAEMEMDYTLINGQNAPTWCGKIGSITLFTWFSTKRLLSLWICKMNDFFDRGNSFRKGKCGLQQIKKEVFRKIYDQWILRLKACIERLVIIKDNIYEFDVNHFQRYLFILLRSYFLSHLYIFNPTKTQFIQVFQVKPLMKKRTINQNHNKKQRMWVSNKLTIIL